MMVLFRKKIESDEPERVFQLTIIEGNNKTDDLPGKVFSLNCGNNLIGRDPLCEVVLNSSTVSRRHANIKISYNRKNFMIYDLGGANSVIIKPSKILKKKRHPLRSGDEFQIGEIILKFLVLDKKETNATLMVDVKNLIEESKDQG